MGILSTYLAPLGMVSVVACTGCANIEMAHVNTTERVTQTDRNPEEKNEPSPKLADGGATPEVTVRQKCELFAVDRVEVTKHKEAKNHSAALDWVLGVSGLATAGIGTWIVLDAGNVYPNDPTSRTYNSLGPSGARTAGFVTLGVGLGMAAIAGVDVIRAQKTDAEVSMESRRRPGAVGTCGGKPVPTAKVEARFEQGTAKGRTVPLGETGADGRLAVDVTRLDVPSPECGLEQQPFGSQVSLVAYGTAFAQADLRPAYTKWIADRRRADQALESAAEEEASACQGRGACTNVKRYLGSTTCYADPRKRERLTALLDDVIWAQANTSACAGSITMTACNGVSSYLDAFPSGRHAAEGRQLVSGWERRRRDAFQRLDAWARSSVTSAWSQKMVTTSTCVNRVDVEVPCDSAAAFEKSDSSAMVSAVTVRNASRLPVTCGLGKSEFTFLGGRATSDAAAISAGGSHVFTAVDAGLGLFLSFFGGGGSTKSVACGVSAPLLSRQVPGASTVLDAGDGQVFFAIVTGDSSTGYVFFTKDSRMFMWDGTTVQELKGKKE